MNSKYLLGDRLVAHCLLPQSHPPAVLQWYINDITADMKHVSRQYSLTRNWSQYEYNYCQSVQCWSCSMIFLIFFILRSQPSDTSTLT